MEKQYRIEFKYCDSMSNWKWRNQRCTLCAKNESEAKYKCMELYGLGMDCDYEIVSVTEM